MWERLCSAFLTGLATNRQNIAIGWAMNSSNAVAISLFVVSASMLMICSVQRRTLMRARLVVNTRLSSLPQEPAVAAPPAVVSAPPVTVPTVLSAAIETQEPCDEVCDACDKKVNDMLGSVKAYDRHVIISVPATSAAEWQRDIELHDDTFPYNLIRYIEIIKKANKPKKESCDAAEGSSVAETSPVVPPVDAPKPLKLKLTAMIEPEGVIPVEGRANVVVYPDNLMFSLRNEQLESFATLVSQPVPLVNAAEITNFQHSKPAWKKLVLVCVHNARDKRCGRAGPQVIGELQRLLEEQTTTPSIENSGNNKVAASEVAVRGSSHIGGHVYAGTMIVYPEGRWYGRVTKSTAPELLQRVLDGTVLEKCERGVTSSKVLQW